MRRTPLVVWVLALPAIACSAADAEGYVWEEYERTRAEIHELSSLLHEKNDEVVARYDRNDSPEALAVLEPIRERLADARDREARLLCRDRPEIPSPEAVFETIGLRVHRRRIDRDQLDLFVNAREADGTLTVEEAAQLRIVLSRAGDGVRNPSSRGASRIHQRIAKALRCYGLDNATVDSTASSEVERSATPPPRDTERLLLYRTCGDPVCRTDGYRGPFPDVPSCEERTEGDPCVTEGARCDLVNDCNMFLVCAREDPSKRCPR